MYKGIDISFWNGLKINFTAAYAAGYSFLYIKATEGRSRREPNAAQQDADAIAAQMAVGYYHFAHLGEDSALDEAALFNDVIQQGTSTLIPVVDVETNKSNLSPAQFTQWLSDFVGAMKGYGHSKVMIYAGTWLMNNSLLPDAVLADCPLWLADYEATPHIPHGWTSYAIWQDSQQGQIPDINGTFDMDICPDITLITA